MDYMNLAVMLAKVTGPETILPELNNMIEKWLSATNQTEKEIIEIELVPLLVMAMASLMPGGIDNMMEIMKKMDMADNIIKKMDGDN